MTVEGKLRAFIAEEMERDGWSAAELTDGRALLDGQVLDSLGIVNLVGFMETEFGVQILDEELTAEHFNSIFCLAQFIRSKAEA
ncbi:MAG TPA: acyl carrier protein [Acidimicrobiales bacterium]|nr:acyl carrier protein [Acidimicrobiales bacterium]